MLKIEHLSKTYGEKKAVDDLSLHIRPGEIYGFIGHNGAGKTTTIKCCAGILQFEQGEITIDGKSVKADPLGCKQQLAYIPDNPDLYEFLSGVKYLNFVADIFGVSKVDREARIEKYADLFDLTGDLAQPISAYSHGMKQKLAIISALLHDPKLIIMDEPSSAIGDEEIDILFQQIFSLREQGVAILYITHKMDEIFRIADEITIIRDGKWIETGPASDYDADKLVARMVGREITNVFPKDTTVPIGDVIFEVRDLTQEKADGGHFRDISFQLRAGEILGFAGLVGAGRSELMRAIFGLDKYTSGSILLKGKELHNRNTRDAINNGLAMVNEDRRTYGLVLGRSIHHNVSLVNLKKYLKGLLNDGAISKDVEKMQEMLQIKIAHENVEAGTLSGGNQQKVVLAKWLVGDVQVMILDEPTRGIDVGAKSEIHKLMTEFARQGMGIIMISSELPEILGMSDRVVMQEGVIQGVLDRGQATQESIMKLATKGVEKK